MVGSPGKKLIWLTNCVRLQDKQRRRRDTNKMKIAGRLGRRFGLKQ